MLRVKVVVCAVDGLCRENLGTGLKSRQVPESPYCLYYHRDSYENHGSSYRRERIYKDYNAKNHGSHAHYKRYPPQRPDVPYDEDCLEQVIQTHYQDDYSEDYVEEAQKRIRTDKQENAEYQKNDTADYHVITY